MRTLLPRVSVIFLVASLICSSALATDNHDLVVTAANVARVRSLAQNGNAEAQFQLGRAYQSGEFVPQDDAEAAKWWERAAVQGNSNAEYRLGNLYHSGAGVKQDDRTAVRWWRDSSNRGNSYGQALLAMAYHLGLGGLPKDDVKSFEILQKAADQGFATAEAALGSMYYKGEGIPKNSAEAIKLWRKAAQKHDGMALSFLGIAYHDGDGVPRDDVEAVKWWREAAGYGHSVGLAELGSAYFAGWGGLKIDYVQAYVWLTLAAGREKRPDERAKISNLLSADKKLLTPEQIDEGERLIKSWKPRRAEE